MNPHGWAQFRNNPCNRKKKDINLKEVDFCEAAAREIANKHSWKRGEMGHTFSFPVISTAKFCDAGMIGGTQMVLVKKSGTIMGTNEFDTVVNRVKKLYRLIYLVSTNLRKLIVISFVDSGCRPC